MAPASVRLRLTAWYACLLALTVAGLGFAINWLMFGVLLERVDAALDFEFEEAAERWRNAGLAAPQIPDSPAAFHEVYYLRVLTARGHILAESPALAQQLIRSPGPLPGSSNHALTHQTVSIGKLGVCRLVVGDTGATENRRIVQIATSLKPLENQLGALRGVLWTILPAGLIIATSGGYWLAGRALAPVERITAAARRISTANLSERVDVPVSGDELGRLAATFNEMLNRIDQGFVMTRQFTADAAHELKTPLASIRTEAEVALLAPRSIAEYQDILHSIVAETERLSRLFERLLVLSFADAAVASPMHPARIDLVARAAAEATGIAAAAANIALQVESLPPAEVDGDEDLLRQVFEQLLENAIKYTPKGGTVTVRGALTDHSVIIKTMTGIGIPPDALPRIFDRFYRVDQSRSRRTGGTGLGLSIARAIVERHKGTTTAISKLGSGSTVRVELPVVTQRFSA